MQFKFFYSSSSILCRVKNNIAPFYIHAYMCTLCNKLQTLKDFCPWPTFQNEIRRNKIKSFMAWPRKMNAWRRKSSFFYNFISLQHSLVKIFFHCYRSTTHSYCASIERKKEKSDFFMYVGMSESTQNNFSSSWSFFFFLKCKKIFCTSNFSRPKYFFYWLGSFV